jgi:hypothetical protein
LLLAYLARLWLADSVLLAGCGWPDMAAACCRWPGLVSEVRQLLLLMMVEDEADCRATTFL